MKKDKLSKPYSVRLPQSTAVKFEKISVDTGRKPSEIIREFIENKQPVIKAIVPKSLAEDRAKAIFFLNKSSNNLNQIARGLNTLLLKGELDEEGYMKYLNILDEINAAMLSVKENFQ